MIGGQKSIYFVFSLFLNFRTDCQLWEAVLWLHVFLRYINIQYNYYYKWQFTRKTQQKTGKTYIFFRWICFFATAQNWIISIVVSNLTYYVMSKRRSCDSHMRTSARAEFCRFYRFKIIFYKYNFVVIVHLFQLFFILTQQKTALNVSLSNLHSFWVIANCRLIIFFLHFCRFIDYIIWYLKESGRVVFKKHWSKKLIKFTSLSNQFVSLVLIYVWTQLQMTWKKHTQTHASLPSCDIANKQLTKNVFCNPILALHTYKLPKTKTFFVPKQTIKWNKIDNSPERNKNTQLNVAVYGQTIKWQQRY